MSANRETSHTVCISLRLHRTAHQSARQDGNSFLKMAALQICLFCVPVVTSPSKHNKHNVSLAANTVILSCPSTQTNKGHKDTFTLVLLPMTGGEWKGKKYGCSCWFMMLCCTSSIDTTFQAPVVWDKNRRRSELWGIERSALVIRNVFEFYHLNVIR